MINEVYEELKKLGYSDVNYDFVNTFPSINVRILEKGRVRIHLFDKYFEGYYGGKYWVKDKFRMIGEFTGAEIDQIVNERFEGLNA